MALSLTRIVHNVENAVETLPLYPARTDVAQTPEAEEVYSEHVVIDMNGAYWIAEYSIDEAGVVSVAPQSNWRPADNVYIGKAVEMRALKAGARNSAQDARRIQAIHDRAVELGAVCDEEYEEEAMLPDTKAVKMLGSNRLGGYAVLWGSDSERDLDGEYFDAQTAEMTSIFEAVGKLPYLYNHAGDATIKSSVVGVVDVLEADDVGLWYEAQLDIANQYVGAIRRLVGRKALGTSSGTLPNARRVEKSGRIARWPISELSATPSPADPRQVIERPLIEVKSAFQAIGLDVRFPADDADPVVTVTPEVEQSTAAVAGETEKAKRLSIELELLKL
jgi:hypothetical protein